MSDQIQTEHEETKEATTDEERVPKDEVQEAELEEFVDEEIDDTPFSQIFTDEVDEVEEEQEETASVDEQSQFEVQLMVATITLGAYWIISPILAGLAGVLFGHFGAMIMLFATLILVYGITGYTIYQQYDEDFFAIPRFGEHTDTEYTRVDLDDENGKCVMCGTEHGEAIKHETTKALYAADVPIKQYDHFVTYDCMECSNFAKIAGLEESLDETSDETSDEEDNKIDDVTKGASCHISRYEGASNTTDEDTTDDNE